MTDDDRWQAKWDQLNQRSRWYSTSLWGVPFAYVGLVTWALEKLPVLPPAGRPIAAVALAMLSVAVFVHVVQLKWLERRAVIAMQALEGSSPTSGGGSRWFMSFAWYIRAVLAVAAVAFFAYAIAEVTPQPWRCAFVSLGVAGLVALLAFIILEDRKRNKGLIEIIRTGMHP